MFYMLLYTISAHQMTLYPTELNTLKKKPRKRDFLSFDCEENKSISKSQKMRLYLEFVFFFDKVFLWF